MFHSAHDIHRDPRYAGDNFANNYVSIPDITSGVYLNNRETPSPKKLNVEPKIGKKSFQSVDNLLEHRKLEDNYSQVNRHEFKSADNLTEIKIPGSQKLQKYEPVEDFQKESIFGSNTSNEMRRSNEYRTQVGGTQTKYSSNTQNHQAMTQKVYHETSPTRGVKNTNNYNSNNNKRYEYSPLQLSSVNAIKKVSPVRDVRSSKEALYTKVNKDDHRVLRSISLENESNSRRHSNTDYSAKIIITDDPGYTNYNEDENAYEPFQVGESAVNYQIREFGTLNDEKRNRYNSLSNNNINMSSIGIQTEALQRGPPRPRRQKSSFNSRNGSPPKGLYQKDLESASLVRRVNHGFGHYDRSPSPPKRFTSPNRISENPIPLLSDTEDSEGEYNRKLDPLARIRTQVIAREKLQEEKEAKERDAMFFEKRTKTIHEINSELQPLTIDEVDALMLEVDKRGRNRLLVARDGHSSSTSRISNNYVKDDVKTSRVHSAPPKEHVERAPEKSTGIFSTLERIRRSNSDKKKITTLEKKEKVEKNKKDKKKKTKIKFFYDPRPQDKPDEDPLKRFDEYRGETSAPDNERRDSYELSSNYYNRENTRNETSRSKVQNQALRRTESYLGQSTNSILRNNDSPQRPPRTTSGERSRERDRHLNNRRDNDISPERILQDINRKSKDNNLKAASSYSSTLNNKLNTLEKQSNKDNYRNEYGIEKRTNKEWENTTAYNNEWTEKQRIRNKAQQYERSNEYLSRESSDSPEQGISLSEKYQSLSRKSSPQRGTGYIEEEGTVNVPIEDDKQPDKSQPRKKFFGAILGEGSRKTSQEKPAVTSSTLPRFNSGTNERSTEVQSSSYVDIEKKKANNIRPLLKRDRNMDDREKKQWETATLPKNESKFTKEDKHLATTYEKEISKSRVDMYDQYDDRYENTKFVNGPKYSEESSPNSSRKGPAPQPVGRTLSFQTRYFGDTDTEVGGHEQKVADYRSLPMRKNKNTPPVKPSKQLSGQRLMQDTRNNFSARNNTKRAQLRGVGYRNARGSAGSSLQSSESEADSHGGSHTSKASRISTSSNRSVYLHPTAVADIPVRKSSDEEKSATTQGRKVTRSFSLVAPWRPKVRRNIEYDNREYRDVRDSSRDSRTGKDSHDGRDSHVSRDSRVSRDGRSSRDGRVTSRDSRDGTSRDSRDGRARDDRGSRDGRSSRDGRDSRDGRVSRDGRDSRDGRVSRDGRISRDGRSKDSLDGRSKDNRDVRFSKENKIIRSREILDPKDDRDARNALPPRPPRKTVEVEPKKVERSNTVHKDSRLASWLRKKRTTKETKGIN